MKYSIIIPTLNEEKLLPDLLKSLHDSRSKFKLDYEIIISDGGSIDKTLEFAKQYADQILSPTNGDIQTISSGRANGSSAAKGETLIFFNADTRINNAEHLIEIIERRFYKKEFAAMTTQIRVYPELEKKKDKAVSAFLNFYFQFINIIGIGMARGECQIIRKNIYDRVGGYNKVLTAGEDFELFTRIRRYGKILFVKDFIVYESPRRYHKWGYKKIFFNWFVNSISSWWFKKSVSRTWEAIR